MFVYVVLLRQSEAEATSRELNRVSPVIKAIREFSDIPLSVDTYRAEV